MTFHLQESTLLISSGIIFVTIDFFIDGSLMLFELGLLTIIAGFLILYLR